MLVIPPRRIIHQENLCSFRMVGKNHFLHQPNCVSEDPIIMSEHFLAELGCPAKFNLPHHTQVTAFRHAVRIMQEVVLANHSKAAEVYLMDDPAGRDYYQSLETARLSKTGKPKPPNMLECRNLRIVWQVKFGRTTELCDEELGHRDRVFRRLRVFDLIVEQYAVSETAHSHLNPLSPVFLRGGLVGEP